MYERCTYHRIILVLTVAFLDESNLDSFKADKFNHEFDSLIFLIGPYHLINVDLLEDDNCTTNQVY